MIDEIPPTLPVGHAWFEVQDGQDKTALLRTLVLWGATDDLIRSSAIELIQNTRTDDHLGRLGRLHRFMSSVLYFREPVEMFQPPSYTIQKGGDCDDHVLTHAALAWSLRYPFAIEPAGDTKGPYHYTLRVGYPPHDEPEGDENTTWIAVETTIPAEFGEHYSAAARHQ